MGGGDLVLDFILLTGCVIGATVRCAEGRGLAGGPVGPPRRVESVTDVRSGSDWAG